MQKLDYESQVLSDLSLQDTELRSCRFMNCVFLRPAACFAGRVLKQTVLCD